MDQVTSLPLPPAYWKDLSVDEIVKMTPPEPNDQDLVVFGREQITRLVVPTSTGIISNKIRSLHVFVVPELIGSMKTDMKEVTGEFFGAIELCITEESLNHTDLLDEKLKTISDKLASIHTHIDQLRIHQVYHELNYACPKLCRLVWK